MVITFIIFLRFHKRNRLKNNTLFNETFFMKTFKYPMYTLLLAAYFSALFCAPTSTFAQATCDFTPSPATDACPGSPVILTVNTPQQDHQYTWKFAAGAGLPEQKGSSATAYFPFSAVQKAYQVTLFDSVSGAGVCQKTIFVQVKPGPDLAIKLAPGSTAGIQIVGNTISLCDKPGNIKLRLLNTTPTASQNTGYTVEWGDGATMTYTPAEFSSTLPIEHNYAALGNYDIRITATHQNGCQYTHVYSFYSGTNPPLSFSSPGATVGLCAPQTLLFSLGGFQGASSATVYQVYLNGALYQSYAQANIQSSIPIKFTQSSCGQGSASVNANIFVVSIRAGIIGCPQTQIDVKPVTVSSAPVAAIQVVRPTNQCPNEIWKFTNKSYGAAVITPGLNNTFKCDSTNNAEWTITGIQGTDWEYVSGGPFDNMIQIRFKKTGSHTVRLKTYNLNLSCPGGYDTKETVITVAEMPTAAAEVQYMQNPNGCIPVKIKMKNNSTLATSTLWRVLPQGNTPANGYMFDLPNGDRLAEPGITFTKPGIYKIKVESSNNCGTDTWETTITILDIPTLTLQPLSVCEGKPLNILASQAVVSDNGSPVTNWNWIFAGGAMPSTAADQWPQGIVFPDAGVFPVTAVATNSCGPQSKTVNVTVGAKPKLDMAVVFSGPEKCTPVLVAFTQQTTQTGVTYFRRITDAQGNTIALPGPNAQYTNGGPNTPSASVNFKKSGTYRVEVIAINQCDTVSSVWEHTFLEKPEVKLPVLNLFCSNATVNFSQTLPGVVATNGGDPAATFKWDFSSGTPNNSSQQFPGSVAFQNNSGSTQTIKVSLSAENACTAVSGQIPMATMNIVLEVPAVIVVPDLAPAYCQNHNAIPLPVVPTGTIVSGTGISNNQFNPGATNLPLNTPIVVTYTHSSGVCSAQKTDTVTVLPVPSVPSFQKQSVCIEKDSLSLPAVLMGAWNIAVPGVLTPAGSGVDLKKSKPGIFALTLTVTSANGCQNTNGFELAIQDNFDPSPPDASYCNVAGLTDLPMNTLSGLVYAGQNVVQPGNHFNPENLTPGSFILPYTMTNSTGCVFLGNITVSIKAPLPPGTVQAGPDRALCSYGVPVLLNGTPVTGIWKVFPSTSALQTSSNMPAFSPGEAPPGIYTLVLTEGSDNCAAHQTDTAMIRVVGLTPGAGAAEKACINYQAFLLTAGGNGSVPPGAKMTWQGVGIIDSITGSFGPGRAGTGNHTIFLVLTDTTSGCTFSAEKNVAVHALAGSKFEIIGVKCVGQELLFQNKTPGTNICQWFSDNILFSNEKNPKRAFPVGAHQAVLISTTNEGCQDTFSVSFTARELPVASLKAKSPTTGCDKISVVFQTQTTHQDSAWMMVDSAGLRRVLPIQQSLVFRNGGTDVVKYWVILAAKSVCTTVYDTVNITVNPDPSAKFEATYYQPCSGQKVTCSVLSKGNPTSSFYFTNENPTHIPANPLSPTVFQWFTDSLPKRIVLYLVSWNECRRDTFSREITVMPTKLSALFNIRADTSRLCPGSSVRVHNGSTPGIPVRWETNWGEKFTGDTVDIILPMQAGIYYVKVIIELCGYDSFFMPIRVRSNPLVTLATSSPVCIGNAIEYKINNSGHAHTLHFGDGDSTHQAISSHIYARSGDFKPFVLAYSLEGCTTRVATMARVFPPPVFSIALLKHCTVRDGVDLTVLTDATNKVDLEGDTGRFHPALKQGLHNLRVKTPPGCFRDTLLAVPEPEELHLSVDTSLIKMALGTAVQLVARINNPDASVIWTHGNFLSDSTAAITTAKPTEDTKFVVTVTALNGCTATATIYVNVDEQTDVYFPNVFTPEKQGGNEVWYPSASPGIVKIRHLQIFIRGGDMVFERRNFLPNDPSEGWRGESRGKKLNPGVFVFTTELERADGKIELYEGDITLIR